MARIQMVSMRFASRFARRRTTTSPGRRPAFLAPLSSPSSSRAPLLERYYPPSSLLLAHAPLLIPLTLLSFALYKVPFAACAIHGWSSGASRLYSADLSRSATSPTPAVYRMHLTSSSPIASAFATFGPARLPATLTLASSRVLIFSRLQTFRYVVALQFAHPPARSLRSRHP